MIPQSFIDTLLQRVDIVDLVGSYVQLKKTGANYSGLCPFHTEKSPSFSVSPSKQFYHCFGCGAHGTAIGFVIEHLGLPFPQAVEELARRVGLDVPNESPDPRGQEDRRRQQDQRQRLFERLAEAARFYQRRLKESPEAIAYLKGRGVTGETAARFHLGFAPEGWHPLQAVYGDYQDPDLVEAGLVIHAKAEEAGDRDRRYDRFRHRLMFPILNERGQVMGFGARTLGQEEPKYLNSPETPVFVKGQSLYGLFEARAAIRASGEVWVVEGYMDVVALAQHGLGHVVATLGTATTADHLRLLGRLCQRVVFMFDGDSAGRRAAAKALELALPVLRERLSLRFVFLPPEHDPDSFVRANGSAALSEFVAQGMSLSSFLLARAAEGQSLAEPEGRAAATAEARRLIGLMPAGDLKNQIAMAAAERFGADPESLGAAARPRAVSGSSSSSNPAGRAPRAGSTVYSNKSNKSNTSNASNTRSAKGVSAPAKASPRRIPSRTDRLMGILVRRPDWAAEVDEWVRRQLDQDQADLLNWLIERAAQGAGFAALHESILAESGAGQSSWSDRPAEGPASARGWQQCFLQHAAPEEGLDAMAEGPAEALRAEFQTILDGLRLRALEARATGLAARAAETGSAEDLESLRQVRHRIAELKQAMTTRLTQ